MAFCKSWINVPHFSPEGLVRWVMDYAIQWQLACKSAPWGSAPWQMCKRRIFHNLQRVADTFAFSLLGLLLNLKHKLQRSRCQKHKNKKKKNKVTQGCSFHTFIFCLPFGVFVPPCRGVGCQTQQLWIAASFTSVLLSFWTVNGPWDGQPYCCAMLIS